MWDGRFDSPAPKLGVIESPLEANSSRLFFAQAIARRYRDAYRAVFEDDPEAVLSESFPAIDAETTGCQLELTGHTTPDEACSRGTVHGRPSDPRYDALTAEQRALVTSIVMNAGKAIAPTSVAVVRTRPVPFHARRRRGDRSGATRRGAFAGKGRCVGCHGGPFPS